MKEYGQFCPVAKASELLGERWTFLIIRELISGSETFNQIRRGVPQISPSLLSTRLKAMEEAKVVERKEAGDGVSYSLTQAGCELQPIIMGLGQWGQRWAPSKYDKTDMPDPCVLMWDMHRRIDTSAFPKKRTVLYFEFTGCPANVRRWWLVVVNGKVDICMKDPGQDVDLYLYTDMVTMAKIWMGDVAVTEAQQNKLLEVTGTSPLRRNLGKWLKLSVFAETNPRLSKG
jgi:DNA-binding HxlR family transcriptional regulator